MKRSSLMIKTLSAGLVCGLMLSLAACGGKKETETEPTTMATTETTPIVTTQTTTEATTLMEYGVSIAPNDVAVTWTEESFDAKVMQVTGIENYLKIRKGPGTDYEQIGSLKNGAQVIVVAKTDNNWYRTQDGYYISGEFLSLVG